MINPPLRIPHDVPYRFARTDDPLIARVRAIAALRRWTVAALVVKDDAELGIGSADNPDPVLALDDARNHSARQALFEALRAGHIVSGADLAIWGCWRLCRSCQLSVNEAGIRRIILPEACAWIARDY